MLFRIVALFAIAGGVFCATPGAILDAATVPANRVDLETDFANAVKYVAALPKSEGTIDEATRMKFYGNYKVATVGPATGVPEGSLAGMAKFYAWTVCSSKTPQEAMTDYIELLQALAPEWRA